ncbi:TonB-dependent receptor plug [Cellulophaga algicola DSM 14237]|uniref:TonB-dependent receptor plug n=1 Tax=Cellulophaga algicola (strain DSM 14237 / IC166 / ACAM 630) TaxID=688270 RepID=E6XFG8_CELAD|nr:TonB-dependent receptor [Cellulophaga algicola]ADV51441.1 TonB-dependent receptor plug [Cellulophaga algicola DSM 14237]
MKLTNLLLVTLVFSVTSLFSQSEIKGTVKDSDGIPLAGANIVVKGSTNGTTTDFDGNYTIEAVSDGTLVFSYIGFETKEKKIGGQSTINITLSEGNQLDEFIAVGSRTAPRSNTDSPLPVDVVGAKDLTSTGQASFDKALQYKIPSFNTVQTPVNDATSLLDPYEIRNMGPSRTLILINGKRKNLSSLLYTQTSPGRGETGADISAIPTDAIKRVEILRDGASAQYGSDAIAGVMNIILKNSANEGSATIRTGITTEGDGEMFGIAVNNGSSIGDDKGFINYTIDLSKVNQSNRPGTVNAAGDAADFTSSNPNSYGSYLNGSLLGGVDLTGFTVPQAVDEFTNNYVGTADYNTRNAAILASNAQGLATTEEFLGRRPDAGNINGSPETASAKFEINTGYELSENTNLYANAAYVYKKVNSFANYRTPYWKPLSEGSEYLADFFPGNNPNTVNGYDGYVPTFEGLLTDYNATIGFKTVKNDWNVDVSFTTGGNTQTYNVNNSHNANEVYSPSTWVDANSNGTLDDGELSQGSELYRSNSQRSFSPGGTSFSHNVGNIDISRILSDKISIGFGSEFRTETFEIIEGGLASYDGGGADSFAGNSPENSGKFNRYNFGGYFDIAYDVSDNFLLNGTIRTENYSDFGNAFVWKLSSRYKFLDDKVTLRGSVSTGFRAPTLHQIYTQKAQYSFVPGQGIQVGGLVNNVSSTANILGLPQLDAEESTNFTVGLGAKINKNFNVTVDYYNIAVKDRIVLSTEIGATATDAVGNSIGNTPLDQVLNNNNLSDISFFVNALDTKTSGIDFVANYKNISLGDGTLDFTLSGNYTIQNERDGAVKNPQLVEDAGQSVVNATQEALFFTSRPKTKWILGANYNINKFGFSFNNTYFGKTTFKQQGLDENLRTEFTPKIVSDLGVNFNATEKLTIALNINNLFNVLPEWGFKAENAAGQALIDDTSLTYYGITSIQEQSNLITFNQRYSQMTYDGYHFSQLGTMLNLSINYRF